MVRYMIEMVGNALNVAKGICALLHLVCHLTIFVIFYKMHTFCHYSLQLANIRCDFNSKNYTLT